MMGIDDFFLSFIASYLAGLLPSLKDIFIKEEKETLQEGVDNCYQKALERWCSDDSVRTCQGTGTWQIKASGANRVGYMKNG